MRVINGTDRYVRDRRREVVRVAEVVTCVSERRPREALRGTPELNGNFCWAESGVLCHLANVYHRIEEVGLEINDIGVGFGRDSHPNTDFIKL